MPITYETKNAGGGRYLWVEGTPVGLIPRNMQVTASVAAHLLVIKNQAEASGKIQGRNAERQRLLNLLGIMPS